MAFGWRKRLNSCSLRAAIVASMGWMVNEAIYMLIAMRGNFLIMYVNEHTLAGSLLAKHKQLTIC